MRRACLALALASGMSVGTLAIFPRADAAPAAVPVQVLAINDLHGRLTLPKDSESRLVTGPGPDGVYGKSEAGVNDDVVVQVGGAYYVAATARRLEEDFRQQAGATGASFFVSSGDLIDESPSAAAEDRYKDEATVEMANALGLDASAVGDDELYRGTRELRRISSATDGLYTDDVTACEVATPGVDGCFGAGEHAFTGAEFPYLAANVVSRETGEPMLPPYEVLTTPDGSRVAFIGVVFDGARSNVPPEGVADVEFLNEADTVNRWTRALRQEGVEAIGVLLHEGGGQSSSGEPPDPNGCEGLTGPVVEINARVDPAVDFIVAGHKHSSYNCLLPTSRGAPRLVTQAGAYGRMVTDIRLTLDPSTGDVDRAATYSAVNVPAARSGSPDARLQSIVNYWSTGPEPQQPGAASASTPAARTDTAENEGQTAALVALVASAVLVLLIGGLRSLRGRRARPRHPRPRWKFGG